MIYMPIDDLGQTCLCEIIAVIDDIAFKSQCLF